MDIQNGDEVIAALQNLLDASIAQTRRALDGWTKAVAELDRLRSQLGGQS